MDSENQIPFTPFDSMIMQDSIQILKASMPYFPAPFQSTLAAYIKLRELMNTLSLYRTRQTDLSAMSVNTEHVSPVDMLQEIRRYQGESAQEKVDQLLFILNAVQLMQMNQEQSFSQEEFNYDV